MTRSGVSWRTPSKHETWTIRDGQNPLHVSYIFKKTGDVKYMGDRLWILPEDGKANTLFYHEVQGKMKTVKSSRVFLVHKFGCINRDMHSDSAIKQRDYRHALDLTYAERDKSPNERTRTTLVDFKEFSKHMGKLNEGKRKLYEIKKRHGRESAGASVGVRTVSNEPADGIIGRGTIYGNWRKKVRDKPERLFIVAR
jgi:hypothetical protein